MSDTTCSPALVRYALHVNLIPVHPTAQDVRMSTDASPSGLKWRDLGIASPAFDETSETILPRELGNGQRTLLSVSTCSDRELWDRARAGEAAAFGELFVLRNRSRIERRHRSALECLGSLTEVTGPGTDFDERLADEQRMKDILRVLACLPKRQQDVLVLCSWMGLAYEEAAVALGLPVGTVRSRLSREKRRLLELLEDCGQAAAGSIDHRPGQEIES